MKVVRNGRKLDFSITEGEADRLTLILAEFVDSFGDARAYSREREVATKLRHKLNEAIEAVGKPSRFERRDE